MTKPDTFVIHLVGNAHLDPVWLWRIDTGIDEALATCRTACDLLDEYPDFHLTRGEAWVYEQVERHDPALLKRILAHVRAGRWHPVGGWYIQPDCNLPTAASFHKQGEIGQAAFKRWFGRAATVGYCVDSFGHTAMIPSFLREAGMDSYVFQRPGPAERELPADVFLWEAPDGQRVTAARLPHGYTTWTLADVRHRMDDILANADRTLGHALLFYGVGDHGGGPTREQMDWLLAHRDAYPGVVLRFSHPAAFFDAIRPLAGRLPVVRGELQHHAIGCYSAVRALKSAMRRAEELAEQAEFMLRRETDASLAAAAKARIDAAWRTILFNQFHDILPGSAIESASDEALDELGGAKTEFRRLIAEPLRRVTLAFPPAPQQRLVLHNISDQPFSGAVEVEPSLWNTDPATVRLTDSDGAEIPFQALHPEAAVSFGMTRLLFSADLAPGESRPIAIHRNATPTPPASGVAYNGHRLWNDHARVRVDGAGIMSLMAGGREWLAAAGLRFVVYEDLSDAWTHGQNKLGERALGTFQADGGWNVWEAGGLRVTLVNRLRWGRSTLICRASLDAGDLWLRLQLRLHWNEERALVRCAIAPATSWTRREDGMPGRGGERAFDGHEYPFHDYTLLDAADGALALVTRDAYSVSVAEDGVLALTLARGPVYAHHDPLLVPAIHAWPAADIGAHNFELALLACGDRDAAPAAIARERHRQTRPIWPTETTLGMPPR